MITGTQILCHLIGDYLLQSNWMALNKVKSWLPAIIHGFAYPVPFLLLGPSIEALFVIITTHIIIDRFRLAKYWIWLNNRGDLNNGGYPKETPVWLSMWLMIIVDNTFHMLINGLALKYL